MDMKIGLIKTTVKGTLYKGKFVSDETLSEELGEYIELSEEEQELGIAQLAKKVDSENRDSLYTAIYLSGININADYLQAISGTEVAEIIKVPLEFTYIIKVIV